MIAALHLLLLLLSAPIIGAVLLRTIATLTGARWSGLQALARPMPWLVPLAALVMLLPVPLPPHLTIWQHPLFVAARTLAATGALAWASRQPPGATKAGIMLALYALLVTPVATDWMLGTVPGHAVSAIGMMLFVQQIAAACAVMLVLGWGDAPTRRDLAKLLVAAMLAMGYLGYMDYLIIWFGNLPDRVPFYLLRGTPGMTALVATALLAGLAIPIAALALDRPRIAGGGALAGIALFDLWWLGGGILPAIAALLALALLFAGGRHLAGA